MMNGIYRELGEGVVLPPQPLLSSSSSPPSSALLVVILLSWLVGLAYCPLALLAWIPYLVWVLLQTRASLQAVTKARAQLVANHASLVQRIAGNAIDVSDDDDEEEEYERGVLLPASVAAPRLLVNEPFPITKTYPAQRLLLNSFHGLDFNAMCYSRLSPDEQSRFQDFKRQFHKSITLLPPSSSQHHRPDDFTLLLFLQADDYNCSKAMTRLESCVRWRSGFGLDAFVLHPNRKLIARYRMLRVRRMVGFDKTGRPLVVERLGGLLSSEEAMAGGLAREEWLMCYAYDLCETMAAFREQSEASQMWVHRINYLGDLANGSISGVFKLISMLTYMGKVAEVNFPECAGNIVLINAPPFAAWAWGLISKVLDPKLVDKIRILRGASREELVDIFGPGALPIEFGGTNPLVLPQTIKRMDDNFKRAYPLV